MKELNCISVSETSQLINEWIKNERDRQIMKRRLIDGIKLEPLAEEFDMSVRNVNYIVSKYQKFLLTKVIPE